MREPSFVYLRRVNFKDTDVAGITHFTNLLAFVEEAEHGALERVGVAAISAAGGFPKVHISCDYRSPARFRDELEVRMFLTSVSNKSLRWEFELVVSNTSRLVAEGEMVTVFVDAQGAATEISAEDREALAGLAITE